MIETFRVVNDRMVDVTLMLREAVNGVRILSIEGLGPVKAELTLDPRAKARGVNFVGSRSNSRNIVLELRLEANPFKSVEAIRREVYNYFPMHEEIAMEIKTSENLLVRTMGRVETIEPQLFAKEPTIQISILCDDPAFVGNKVTHTLGSQGSVLTYHGRIATGITLDINFKGLTNTPPPQGFFRGIFTLNQDAFPGGREIQFSNSEIREITSDPFGQGGDGLKQGDRIVIVTDPGSKSATLYRDAREVDILPILRQAGGYLLPEERWPMVIPEKPSTFWAGIDLFSPPNIEIKISWFELIEGL